MIKSEYNHSKSVKSEKDEYDVEHHEEIPNKKGFMDNGYKNLFYGGILLGILVWGTAFLILTISRFQQNQIATLRIESYLKKISPPLLNNGSDKQLNLNRPLSFDNGNKVLLNFSAVRDGLFKPHYKELQWIREPESINNDKGTYVLKEENEDETRYLIKSILDSDYQYTLYNDSSFQYNNIIYDIDSLTASPDLTKAILKTNTTQNWRHSSFAIYWTLDVASNNIKPIYNEEDKLSITSWSPTSSHVAFVHKQNIYIKYLQDGNIEQVTFDGSSDVLYGIPDWVYEEEVFSGDSVLWWSPKGDKLSFLKTNDTLVPTFSIPYYVQENYEDYPEYRKIKYPKAGYANPVVDLVVYELNSASKKLTDNINIMDFDLSEIEDRLITEVIWVSDNFLLVKISNRASDVLEIYLVTADTHKSKLVRKQDAKNSWFEITSNTLYVPKNQSLGRINDGYIDTVVIDGYNHLAYFSPPENPHGIVLTKGQWEVVDGVASFDYNTNEIYFISTFKSSIERHIHSVNLHDAIFNQQKLPVIKNVTDISNEGWYSGSFSSGSRYLLLNYQGPKVPYQKLIDLHEHTDIKSIETNEELSNNLKNYLIPEVRYSVVSLGYDDISGEEVKANAVETLPLNFDPSYKYPVLFFVYGGPGSQLVTKNFAISFSSVVAAELDSIVVTVDGRGTGFNSYNEKMGSDFKFVVRDKLGHFEPLDQIAAAKLWSQKPYVDRLRIGIWGWSYGGFLTLKTLETDSEDHIFSYGAAVAPVTKWKLYDSIYTERYMRKPQDNPQGYQIASIHNVTNFANVDRFLIMHGSGDDNVHFQNSLKLIDDFNLESIENFDFMVFPDSDHSIRYHNGNIVVYDRLLEWLKKAFTGHFTRI